MTTQEEMTKCWQDYYQSIRDLYQTIAYGMGIAPRPPATIMYPPMCIPKQGVPK